VLQTIVSRANLHLVDGTARVVRRGVTLAPSGGTKVTLRGRPTSPDAQLQGVRAPSESSRTVQQ
jgi:hypothetical protein